MSDEYTARPGREAELVLSPNEFAYVLDKTKGHVTTWVGPTKTSLSNTDSPVVFDTKTFAFVEVQLSRAIQKLTVIPESWYGQLKNPADAYPKPGNANSSADLKTGQKVNVKGPAAFALFPGQMIRVIRGHSLRSNQYLIIRVYDNTKIKPAELNIPAIKADETSLAELAVGKQFVIKGTEMPFFIPPDGIEVVREGDSYIRDALTLEQLEYCILLNEDGDKRYVKGPAVVFPTVTETFVTNDNGSRKFRALELTPTSGVYIKVTADYTDDITGASYVTGQELFITGNEQMIYFPRKEHTLIRYGNQPVNYATAVEPGAARYLLNKNTGEVTTKVGPTMLLPDPRAEVFINRILTNKECRLLFPGNHEVYSHNNVLAEAIGVRGERGIQGLRGDDGMSASVMSKSMTFDRGSTPHKPHSITIDSKFEGAVKFDVWTGYAVQLVKGSERRVVVGPAQVILDYDETIEVLNLSSGNPKNTDSLIETAFLRYNNNKVSDTIHAQTADFVNVAVKVSFLVNFELDKSDVWFNVDNYVKLMSDRVRSKVKRTIKGMTIRDFYADGYNITRRRILGEQGSSGMHFEENGMVIADVDILKISIDSDVESQLETAANKAFRDSLTLEDLKAQATQKEEALVYQTKITELTTALEASKLTARKAAIEAEEEILDMQRDQELDKYSHNALIKLGAVKAEYAVEEFEKTERLKLDEMATLANINLSKLRAEANAEIKTADLLHEIEADAHNIEYKTAEAAIEKETLAAQAAAQTAVLASVSPHLISELKRVADTNENFKIADTLARSIAPTALIAGKSMADILVELSQGTVYADLFKGVSSIDVD